MTGSRPAISSDLWQRLANYEVGPPAATFGFADRLARENRWSADFTALALREYKRFCYLAITAGHEVTPSDAVDQVWHLHLTFTRDYWQRFCPDVLGCDLHHGPTEGGTAERNRFYDQYARTMESYEKAFGEAPPEAVWPSARRRFAVDPRAFRVNPADFVVVPRLAAKWLAGAIGAAILFAAVLIAGG